MKNTGNWKASDLAFLQQSEVFAITKQLPKEELYSLTSQVRRSSRAICANLAEAYSKRRYVAHFVSKLTDAEAENNETNVWLKIALDCEYVSADQLTGVLRTNEQVGKLLYFMIHNPEKFCFIE
jgi:four helix bundle protein